MSVCGLTRVTGSRPAPRFSHPDPALALGPLSYPSPPPPAVFCQVGTVSASGLGAPQGQPRSCLYSWYLCWVLRKDSFRPTLVGNINNETKFFSTPGGQSVAPPPHMAPSRSHLERFCLPPSGALHSRSSASCPHHASGPSGVTY